MLVEKTEKPLPKLLPKTLPSLYSSNEKGLDLTLGLPLHRFYNKFEETHSRRIPILLDDKGDETAISPKIIENEAKLKSVDKPTQKTTWGADPLRLCLVDGNTISASASPLNTSGGDQEDRETRSVFQSSMPFNQQAELPYTFKMKSAQAYEHLLAQLYVPVSSTISDYTTFVSALPYAPASNKAPMSPLPKLLLKTSLSLSPAESYAPPLSTAVEPGFYSHEDDQITSTATSPTITSTFLSDEDNQGFTKETWEAIFHPLSTFRHKKGGLEYYTWNPANLPLTAVRVAQRVIPTRGQDTTASVEATIPQLMPTTPSFSTPELMLNDETRLQPEEEGYYYDMLQKIRGRHRYSHGSSIETRLDQSESLSDEHVQSDESKQGLIARIASASSLSAIFLGNTPINEKKLQRQEHHKDPETLLMVQQKPCYWTTKRLFWTGFVCPLLWYYGSFQIRASNGIKNPSDLRWQKRCRMAALYFSIILSVVILVVFIKAAGVAGVRQTQSDTIRAVIAN
jgi:hypothetical protein